MIKLLLLISHTISDFCLQSDKIVKLKSDLKWQGFYKHGLSLLISYLIFIFIKFTWQLFLFISIIIIIHLVIDVLKVVVDKHTKRAFAKLLSFIVDQALHIFIIILFTSQLKYEFTSINAALSGVIGSPFTEHNLKVVFIILYIALSGASLIPLLLNVVYSKINNYNQILSRQQKKGQDIETHIFFSNNVNVGKWVGILERLIIGYCLIDNQFGAIGFTIAVKSLARFKMMDDKVFAEYYLLGTLFSVTYTFIAFSILQKII